MVTEDKQLPARKASGIRQNQYEVLGKIYHVLPSNLGYLEIGIASWYGKKFHGRLTALGETYSMYEMTAAHKSLPLPTMVKVTNLDNARSIVVRVNDRGPFHDDRVIDLSYAAARSLGFDSKGTAPVVVEALDEINHPEVVRREESRGSYYLQIGAFQLKNGAEQRLFDVLRVLPRDVESRILESETDVGTIYKVWIGPMLSLSEEERISAIIAGENLGNPLRVKIN